jgi:hypothetical protein
MDIELHIEIEKKKEEQFQNELEELCGKYAMLHKKDKVLRCYLEYK